MPLTPFQKRVVRILAANRNPESHIAGGAVINRAESSLRFSDDLDIFHDVAESVAASAEADAKALQEAGYAIEWIHRQVGFYRAVASRGEDQVRLEWTSDFAFRFFPVQPDEDFGYCLHPADLAVNKVLALAGRTEIRDFLDILFLDETYLNLGALMWAACGKDAGYTPALLLDQTNRHSRFQENDLKGENLARPVDLRELKRRWLAARERAEGLFALLPEEELGCLYLAPDNIPVTPDPNNPDFPRLVRHFGSIRGAWPNIPEGCFAVLLYQSAIVAMCRFQPRTVEKDLMILDIDPKVDYAFKHLFGREVTRPILMNVLDSVLNPPPGHHIRDIELLNPFNPKEALDDKLSILDIKARDQSGRQFNIEMQMLALPHYAKRILYYACKLHQQQLHEGQDYLELRPTVSISFLNHVWFPKVPDYHLSFRLREQVHGFALTDDLEFHVLELPKFTKSAAELATGLDIWLYFLRHAEMMDTDAVPAALQQPLVLRALEELKVLTQTDLERERYEARRKAQLDHNTVMKVARLEGRAEGVKIGNIQMCERLLNRPETPTATLAALSLEELSRLAEELQGQILKSRGAS